MQAEEGGVTVGFRFAPGGRERLLLFDSLLDAEYGAPELILGNHPNPLDEAVYIILSFQTDLRRFRDTWTSLRATFPRWDDVDRAHVKEVADVLCTGGLHRQKSQGNKATSQGSTRRIWRDVVNRTSGYGTTQPRNAPSWGFRGCHGKGLDVCFFTASIETYFRWMGTRSGFSAARE